MAVTQDTVSVAGFEYRLGAQKPVFCCPAWLPALPLAPRVASSSWGIFLFLGEVGLRTFCLGEIKNTFRMIL